MNLFFNSLFLFRQHLLDLEGGHTTTSGTGDRLSVPLVLYVAGSEHSPHARLRGTWDSQDVSISIDLKLVAHDGCGGLMTDSVEESGDGKVFLFTAFHILDAEIV